MQRNPNEIDDLSFQANHGNVSAREKLRQLLFPAMILIVRRTLEMGQVRSNLSRQIFLEYRRVAAQIPFGESSIPSNLIELVARRLSDHYLEQPCECFHKGQPISETVLLMNETVVA